MQTPSAAAAATRFQWIDSVRGMAIVWIAFFHCFIAYGPNYPWPITLGSLPAFVDQCLPGALFGKIGCYIEGLIAGTMERGAQGVGVFILFSGFGLTYSLVKRGQGKISWGRWYFHRFIRLFPIYWLAHLVFLVSPFQYRPVPFDYRFILSFLGDRVFPVDTMFFYLSPAWWFIGMLIELYIVFPLLYRLMQRMGSGGFFALCIALTVGSRYLLHVSGASGNYQMGALFLCRLWEFSAGMILGKLMAEDPQATARRLFSFKCFAAGIIVYVLGQLSYQPNALYILSDGLSGTGLSVIMVHIAALLDRAPVIGTAFARAGVYSYSLYLFHQPYVMYLGEHFQRYHIGVFFIVATAAIAVIALIAGCVEKGLNKVVHRYIRA